MSKRWKAHQYQKYCVLQGIIKRFLAFLLDPGLGKTTIILEIYRKLKNRKKSKGVLIVAPKRVCFLVWPKEIKKWGNFKGFTYTVLHDEWGNKNLNIRRKKDFYIINPEGLDWLIKQLKGKRKKDWPFDMLVVDESTKFKDTSTNRFKFIKKLVPHFNRRYILTGTPAPNGLQNLQGQLYIVDQGESFGIVKKYFYQDYFTQVGNPKWKQFQPRPDKLKKLYKKFAKFAIRLRAEDYLELPSLIENIIEIELPPKARKKYNQMEKEFFVELDKKEITALSKGSSYQKCWQMANGALYKQDESVIQPGAKVKPPTEFHIIHNAKIEALENLIDELGGKPLLIGYSFRHDLIRLKKHFGKRLHNLGKGATMLDCMKIEKQFNKGEIKLLAAYPGTAALGLNLQETCSNICYFSLTQDYEAYDQFIKRVWRQGVKGDCTLHILLAKNTVDELILKRNSRKEKVQKKFLDFCYEYKKKRLQQYEDMV